MANPNIVNVDHRQLPAGDNRWIDVTLAQGESVVKDQALGIETVGREWAALQSGASDGSQLIRGFAAETVDATAAPKTIRVLIEGDVDDSQIVFDGSDSLTTVPALPTGQTDDYFTQLRDYQMFAKTLKDHFIQDNQ